MTSQSTIEKINILAKAWGDLPKDNPQRAELDRQIMELVRQFNAENQTAARA